MPKTRKSASQEWFSSSFGEANGTRLLKPTRSGTINRSKKQLRKFSQPLSRSTIEVVDLLSDDDDELIFVSENKPSSSSTAGVHQDAIDCTLPLVDRFTPTGTDQLAVHNKKIAEVKNWLLNHRGPQREHKCLLLLGPCGSGKTATVKTLCDELKFELTEWESPDYYEIYEENTGESLVRQSSQIRVFEDFLKTASLGSLEKKHVQRVVLIEQLPNAFYREPDALYSVLRRYVVCSACIYVFIMSAVDSSWYLNPRRVFPLCIVNELHIDTITFNSCAVTLLQKALKRVVSELKIVASPLQIKRIAESANGDIRMALNNLQISLGKGGRLLEMDLHSSSSQLDPFHTIGKILYAKRTEEFSDEWNKSEDRLNDSLRLKYKRPYPLKDDVEKILCKSGMTAENLVLFIQEHELAFIDSVEDVSKIFDSISLTDCALKHWELRNNSAFNEYEAQVVARYALFYNYGFTRRAKGMYNFTKPRWTSVQATSSNLRRECLAAFPYVSSEDLFTCVIPILLVVADVELEYQEQRALSLISKNAALGYNGTRHSFAASVGTQNFQGKEMFDIEEVVDSD